ncbi:putative trancriptional regulator, ArsR family [Halalkaliarchaeum sp. AArc-CO]|uniref:DUF7344 domain-containing protein n=1 Tax=Halalkaliarchaeum sp. AArc-CO TaxID=2866381 RepID=UPI00217E32FF|nr:hypothetical protein [Halalkaliarchaeum sp. AArc-CO]UWG50186.1 putative trancriptional regulator, ArsR family [Halalkaliarchaeum sp. AArc-CO]
MFASKLGSADSVPPKSDEQPSNARESDVPKAESEAPPGKSESEPERGKTARGSGPPEGEGAVEGSTPDATEITSQSRQNGADLTKDELFDLLKNSRRRTVINYLRDEDGSANLSEVAEHIAARENDISVQELSSAQRKRVYIGLYQCHLPKMDESGVVEYDKHRGTIELQDSVTQLLPYMETSDDEAEETGDAEEIHREQLTVLAAVCVSALVTAGALGVGALSVVPPVGWALLAAAGLVGLPLLQLYS